MTAITTSSSGEMLVVEFLDRQFLDSQRIQQVGRELLAVVPTLSGNKLVLSFKGVAYMSSAMINELVSLNKACKTQGVTLEFSNVQPNVMEVFKITRLFGDDGPQVQG